MNFLKSIFSKPQPTQIKKPEQEFFTSILDSSFTQVRLKDIKALIKNQSNLDLILNHVPESLNEQLKILYTVHMLMTSGQIQTIDKVVNCFEFKQAQVRQVNTTQVRNTNPTQMNNKTQQCYSEQAPNAQFHNSLYLNVSQQIQQFEAINQNESDLANCYFNYIQRIINNSDVYNACKYNQYPFQVENAPNRKMQLLWLFKINNLMNFKLALLKYLENCFKYKTINTPIIKDISYLIYKDCLCEYSFLRSEVSDMIEIYSQFQIKEGFKFVQYKFIVLEFYEIYVNLQQITSKLRLFHSMRLNFTLNSASARDVKWFEMDKKTELEIDHYIAKAKLLNTSQFKKSLQVPNQKAIIENLHRQVNNPKLKTEPPDQKTTTTKNSTKKVIQLFSPTQIKNQHFESPQKQLESNKN